MKFQLKKTLIIALVLITSSVTAADWLKPAFGLWGVGAALRDRNYLSVKQELTPAIFIFGGYGRFSIEANRIAYTFYRDGTNFVSAAAQIRSHQYRKDDPGLSDRKSSIELGLQVGRRLPLGFVNRLSILFDISGLHKSYELDAQLFRHDHFGPLRLLSAIGVQFQQQKLVKYYYGTANYQPKGAFVAELEFIASYRFWDFGLFAGTRIFVFDKQVLNSPIVRGNRITQFFAGLGYYL